MTNRAASDFALIESMLYEHGYQRLDRHLARLEAAASELGFAFEQPVLDRLLKEQARRLSAVDARYKVRLLLESDGFAWISAERIQAEETAAEVMIAERAVSSADAFARFKTTRRELFDRYAPLLQQHSLVDVIFLNEQLEVAEASRSSVFVERDGSLLTPPLRAGILPGVYRAFMLETDERAREQNLTVEDLEAADAVYLCNSVRGWREVRIRPGRLSLDGV